MATAPFGLLVHRPDADIGALGTIDHWVHPAGEFSLQVHSDLAADDLAAHVSNVMRPRVPYGHAELVARPWCGEHEVLEVEWTDGVLSIWSWFTRDPGDPIRSVMLELDYAVDGRTATSMGAASTRRLAQSLLGSLAARGQSDVPDSAT